MAEVGTDNYTFGDNARASARLRRVAALYEPETLDLLGRSGLRRPRVAVDLGCGPGWSTRLVRDALRPNQTVGLDASERYVAEARYNNEPELEFQVHDVARVSFPVPAPNVMFCRFLLTHLRRPGEVLTTWGTIAAPGAVLIVHETESLEADHPSLRRYYDLVGRLQQHYGQCLQVGSILEGCFGNTGWRLVESRRTTVEKPASAMAEVHLANLRTWRQDPYASRAFDSNEIDLLEASLERIAWGQENAGAVVNVARQIIAQRR